MRFGLFFASGLRYRATLDAAKPHWLWPDFWRLRELQRQHPEMRQYFRANTPQQNAIRNLIGRTQRLYNR